MKKEQRAVFLELAYEVDSGLCVFCKFSKCEGGMSPCDHGELYCAHKLRDELPEEDVAYPGTDCWGFKNNFDVSFCADITGIVLQNGWDDWVFWQNKNGVYKITGSITGQRNILPAPSGKE